MRVITFPISKGITEQKHRLQIGPAVWLFMWLIDLQTDALGRVLGGACIPLRRIAGEMRMPEVVVRKHMRRLRSWRYIATTRARDGVRIRILNQKKFLAASPIQMDRSRAIQMDRSGRSKRIGQSAQMDRSGEHRSLGSSSKDLSKDLESTDHHARDEWLTRLREMRERSPRAFAKVASDLGYRAGQLEQLNQELDAVKPQRRQTR